MNRRRFLNSAASFFAVLAMTGPKLLEDRFHSGGFVTRTGPALVPDGRSRLPWKAAQRLRIAEHVIETAQTTMRMLAGGAHPAVVAAFGAAQKARLDDIRRQAPPWVQRRSVTIPGPEVP